MTARRAGGPGLARRLAAGFALAGLVSGGVLAPAVAQAVDVVFALPEEVGELPVFWSALPLEGQAETAVSLPDPVTGPWAAQLVRGTWLVSAVADDGRVFETILQIAPGAGQVLVIPEVEMAEDAAHSCHAADPCAVDDPETGLSFTLPPGWAAETPFLAQGDDGQLFPTGGFFELEAEGGSYWALNPLDWADEAGPCREVAVGRLCTFEDGAGGTRAAETAFAVIAPSLRWQMPDPAVAFGDGE